MTLSLSDPVIYDPESFADFLQLSKSNVADRLRESGGAPLLGRETGLRLERLISAAQSQLQAAGINTVFVIQPDASAPSKQRAAALYTDPHIKDYHVDAADSVTKVALAELPPSVHNLRNQFTGQRRPVFVDLVHLDEHGAALTAGAMWPFLAATL